MISVMVCVAGLGVLNERCIHLLCLKLTTAPFSLSFRAGSTIGLQSVD